SGSSGRASSRIRVVFASASIRAITAAPFQSKWVCARFGHYKWAHSPDWWHAYLRSRAGGKKQKLDTDPVKPVHVNRPMRIPMARDRNITVILDRARIVWLT